MGCFLGSRSCSVSVTYVLCFKPSRVCLACCVCVFVFAFKQKVQSLSSRLKPSCCLPSFTGSITKKVEKHISRMHMAHEMPPPSTWRWLGAVLHQLVPVSACSDNTGEPGFEALTSDGFLFSSLFDSQRECCHFARFISTIEVVHLPYVPVSLLSFSFVTHHFCFLVVWGADLLHCNLNCSVDLNCDGSERLAGV